MNWLFPGFLAGATLIALPVFLHLLRRKPREIVRFPTLRFLGESAQRDTQRNRLLRWLTLSLRCLAIVLLCAAFARPFFGKAPVVAQRAMVIALDNSMSQQVSGRWDETQRWSSSQLSELGEGDLAGVLVMEPEPVWLVPMTDDLERVRKALAAVKPGYEKTRYARPLRMAGEALASTSANTKILAWAADEQRVGWSGTDLAQQLPTGINFRFLNPAPAPRRQAAIIALRRITDAPDGIEATVREYETLPERREITVLAGNKPLTAQSVLLRPGDNTIRVACDWPAKAPGLRVSLDADDLPADDSAWIAMAGVETNKVLLDATPETDFLAHALKATQKIAGGGFQPEPLPDHNWPMDSAVVLRNDNSFAAAALPRLDQFCEAGGPVWIFITGGEAEKSWLKEHGVRIAKRPAADEPWHLRDWDARHPALAAFAGQSLLPLLQVEFYQGFNLAGDALSPVANWPDGKMAIAEFNNGREHFFLTGFPLDRAFTDWPSQPSLVPFVHCTMRWLGSFNATREDWRVGDTIALPDEEGTWRTLDAPMVQNDLAVNGSIRPGVLGLYEFIGHHSRKVFAVNTPVEESDLSPWPNTNQLAALESTKSTVAAHTASVLPAALAKSENRQRFWWWLLAFGGCVLLAELALSNRAWR